MDKLKGEKAVVNLKDNVGILEELSLSYYTMPITVVLCQESILSLALQYNINKQMQNNQNGQNQVVKISDIIETSMLLQDIFKYEFLVLQDNKLDEKYIKKII